MVKVFMYTLKRYEYIRMHCVFSFFLVKHIFLDNGFIELVKHIVTKNCGFSLQSKKSI